MTVTKHAPENSPHRVLMTADGIGGVWTYALELCRVLGSNGVEVALATMGASLTADQRAEALALPWVELFESAYRLEWMEDPWSDVERAGEWLLALEEEVRPDIVHLNCFSHGDLPFRAPTLMVGHSCVLSWWEAVLGERAPASWGQYAMVVREGLRAADVVAAPTKAMLKSLREFYGRRGPQVRLSNARNPNGFHPQPKENFILTAGRLWDRAKNIRALDVVAPHLSWPVYAAGADQAPDGQVLPFDNLVKLGFQPPECLASWMGRAAIYALPARYEPFGLSVLEAALSGCALVLGDIPSLREVWGNAAFFIQPEDHPSLLAALELLIEDERLRLYLAAEARARALRFSPRRMAREHLAAYSMAAAVGQCRH
jgi:glycosyltransferase involved in cell wall biosynthesis